MAGGENGQASSRKAAGIGRLLIKRPTSPTTPHPGRAAVAYACYIDNVKG